MLLTVGFESIVGLELNVGASSLRSPGGLELTEGAPPPTGTGTSASLMKAKHAELVGDEVQASKEEGLGWLEDGRNPHPNRWECGKLQRAKANHNA